MPSPDERLPELRRQRALVQEQLAFLDREIAAATGEAKPAAQIPPPLPAAQSQPAALPAVGGEADELIKSLEAESRSSLAEAKWGCIWIFVAALVLLALGLFALYLYASHHQSPLVQ